MSDSPLAEVVRDQRINIILEAIRGSVRSRQPIVIEPKDIDYIRRSFEKGLSLGERKLYDLVQDVLTTFEPQKKEKVLLVTWGRCAAHPKEDPYVRETELTHEKEKMNSLSDSFLASQFPPTCPECKSKCPTIASFVRHVPLSGSQIQFIQTRIKTTSNICYKIADLVFDIDFMFQRDKIYNGFSQIVSDIYGLKVIVNSNENLRKVIEYFRNAKYLTVVEEKDYTGVRRKKSGYEAFKLVVRLEKQLFEVQIQTHQMFEMETSNQAANHRTYKEIQMSQRKKLGQEYVSLYRALSQLLSSPDQNYCSIDYIEIGQTLKGADDEF